MEFFKAGLDLDGFRIEYFTDYERAVAWMSEGKDLSDGEAEFKSEGTAK